jgi:hypothetical protein
MYVTRLRVLSTAGGIAMVFCKGGGGGGKEKEKEDVE